jgi:hypothetical protein
MLHEGWYTSEYLRLLYHSGFLSLEETTPLAIRTTFSIPQSLEPAGFTQVRTAAHMPTCSYRQEYGDCAEMARCCITLGKYLTSILHFLLSAASQTCAKIQNIAYMHS